MVPDPDEVGAPGGPVTLALSAMKDGRRWDLYSVAFETVDGKFSTYIYALGFEHAAAIVEELKESATLAGRVCGIA